METLFSTDDVHPRDRFDYWHDVACRSIVQHDSRPECRLTFRAGIQTGMLADIGVIQFENSPMEVARAARHIAQVTEDVLFICRQMAGTLHLEHDGREIALESGHMTLLDPLLAYAGRFSSDSNLLVLKVPRRALQARVGNTSEMVIRDIDPCAAEGGLTSALLAMLPTYTGRIGPAAQEIVRDQVLDLIAVSLTGMIGSARPRVSSGHALALMKVRAAIEARLTDAALDATAVAAAAGISVRYANAVLAHENTSIMRLIQARRLERCRKALQDPSQTHRTLSEIAYGWGFSDMTHFGRRFKAAYGVLPSEYRDVQKRAAGKTGG
jgi:AraC family transcriptional activator of tynA and feaB